LPILGNDCAHLLDFRFANKSPLNDARFQHNRDHGRKIPWSPEKNENIFPAGDFPCTTRK
jgi:hypothetical protein